MADPDSYLKAALHERYVVEREIGRGGKDGYNGPYYEHVLAPHLPACRQTGKALDQLEPLLKVSYFLSPEWLRIDPAFESLRGNPRFERLGS